MPLSLKPGPLGVASVMETKRIVELPLNGRNAGIDSFVRRSRTDGSCGRPQLSEQTHSSQPQAHSGPAPITLWTEFVTSILMTDRLAPSFPDALAEFKVEITGLSAKRTESDRD